MTDPDQNPDRPVPHGMPDRRYLDRSERIPPAELAGLVDEFLAGFVQPVKTPTQQRELDSYEARMVEFSRLMLTCPDPGEYYSMVPYRDESEPDEGDDYDRGEQ